MGIGIKIIRWCLIGLIVVFAAVIPFNMFFNGNGHYALPSTSISLFAIVGLIVVLIVLEIMDRVITRLDKNPDASHEDYLEVYEAVKDFNPFKPTSS